MMAVGLNCPKVVAVRSKSSLVWQAPHVGLGYADNAEGCKL